MTQRIKVKPDTCYQISYKYYIPADADRKISFRSNEFEKYGLYTAILQDPVYYLNSASASQYHTAIRSQIKNDPTRGILNYSGNEGPRWETSSQFYVMSGDNNNLDLGIALGTKENPVKGEVWFTALSVKQYDPAKLSLISRYPIANNNGFSNSKAGEIAMLCIGGLFATGASLAFIFLIVNSLAKNKDTVQPDITPDKAVMAEKQAGSNDSTVAPAKKLSKPLVITPAVLLGAVMFIGFILRIVLSFFVKGDAGIIGSAEAAFAKLKTAGLSGYISESSPLLHLMPLSAVFLRFASLFIGGIDSFGILLLLKLPNILSDLAIAFVIFKFAGSNKKLGSVLAAVYLINPFTILSTLSLKTDTVFILAIILTAYFMLNKKYLYLFISYTAAILLNLDALLIAPVIVTYLAIKFAQSVKYCIDNRANGTRNNLRSKDGSLALTIPTFTLASFAVFYLLSLPMTFNIYDANPIKIFEYFFVTPINSGSLMSAGGMNIFAMLSQSGKAVSAGYSGAWYAFVIFCLLSAITCAFYLVKKNRIVILLAMTLSVYTISVLFTGAGEAFGLPVVSLLLATFAVTKDRRILFSAMFYSLIGFANQYIGLMNSYGFSFLPDYLFNPLINPMYNGSSIITGGIYNYALVFLSTLNLIGFAFFCYTFIRIAFESKVSLRFSVFKPREGFVPFGAALKDFVSRSKR